MSELSSSYFNPRENDLVHQLYKRVRMMPLYSFPCLKYFNLSKKEHTNRFFIHFDLDCFYCQVETRDNPKYKGHPVGVISVSDSKYKGIVMTTNYEARDRGIGIAIKQEIWNMENLTTSLGLSFNKTYAKMATKLQKPNGLTMIRHEDREKILYSLSVDKIWGIGSRIKKRLSRVADLLGHDSVHTTRKYYASIKSDS